MIFYTISILGTDANAQFCGFHRRWYNFFLRRPEFREANPWDKEVVAFSDRELAVDYAAKNLRGHLVQVFWSEIPDDVIT